jgi:GPH family glycoside/pentoside/hexuronide:cation symporter
MATSQAADVQHDPVSEAHPATRKNSPLVYGLGALGSMAIGQAFGGYYQFYYADVLGLAVALLATINVVYGIWDIANNPLVGYLSDNTRARWGRRRPWLLVALPFVLVMLVLAYAVPEPFREGSALFWYALAIVFLFETFATVMFVNYQALFPELFQRFRERTRASAYAQGFGMVGELIGFALTPIVYTQFGFEGMAVLYAIVFGILVFVAVLTSSEDPKAQSEPPLRPKGAFGDVLRDRLFWHFAVVTSLVLFTTAIYILATPFWTKYTLGAGPQAPALIFGAVFGMAILSVAVWSRLVRRLGTKRAWLWAIGMVLVATVLAGLVPNLFLGVIGAALAGAGFGGTQVCREMILAKLVDGSLERTGRRQEGIYYSLSMLFGRLSKIVQALALLLLLVLFGYVSGEDPGPHPDTAFRFLIGVLPLVCLVPAWILARRFPMGPEE